MVREDAVQVKLVISNRIWNAFRAEISVNQPYFNKGYQSAEAEKALQYYIVLLHKRRSNKQQSTLEVQNVKKQEELVQLRDSILDFLIAEGYMADRSATDHQRIIEKHLREAINFVKNVEDKRTINKWIDRLFHADLIRRVDVRVYKFNNLDQPAAQENTAIISTMTPTLVTTGKVQTLPSIKGTRSGF